MISAAFRRSSLVLSGFSWTAGAFVDPAAHNGSRRQVQTRIAPGVVPEDRPTRREREVEVGDGREDRLQLGRCLEETLFRPPSLDGSRHLLRHEIEDRLVLLPEPHAFRVTLDDDYSNRLAEARQGRPDPVHRRRSHRFDFPRAYEVLEHRLGGEERASAPEDVFGEATA